MGTALEVSESSIRLCRTDQGRLVALESYPIPDGSDPIAALEAAPLPRPLGPVRVAIKHADLLLRPMVQPPVPADRLQRIVRFELQSLSDEGLGDLLIATHVPSIGGSGDLRVLAMVAKKQLVERLRGALEVHGGRLQSLVHPAVGTYRAWRHQEDQGTLVLVDCGGANVHVALVLNGELTFLRSHSPGLDELVGDVAELRGIARDDARRIIRKLGAKPPEDIAGLIERHAGHVASLVENAIRFAKANLRLTSFEPHAVHVAGSGARVPGFVDTLAERLHAPARLLNPFAGRVHGVPAGDMDALAQLPSPWCTVVGAACAPHLELDVMDQVRAERQAYWRTDGALRAAAIAAVVLVALALGVLELRNVVQGRALERLDGAGGLVPIAEAAATEASGLQSRKRALGDHMAFLDDQRLPGRVAVELLNVVASVQDPREMPIYVRAYRVQHPAPGTVSVELEGFAEDAGSRTKAQVLNGFEAALREGYPLIAGITHLQTEVGAQRQPFHWIITVDDRG